MGSAKGGHVRALGWAGLISVAAYVVPLLGIVFLPMRYLNTHIHELCQGIAATLTGGEVQGIAVFANGSGTTPIRGGNLLLTASAGYIGASFLGAAILAVGKTPQPARAILRGLGIAIGLSSLLWVRQDAIGVMSGFGWSVALLALSFLLQREALLFAVQFVGLQQCLNAVSSVLVLFQISAYGEVQSDAGILQQTTGLPATIWAFGWVGLSVILIALGFRASLEGGRSRRRSASASGSAPRR